jgi:hypothetical protein
MGKQFRVKRKVATVPISAGGFINVDLPRSYDLESVFMRIYGQVQVTTAGTAVRAEAPCQAVSRCELVADGKNNLFSAPFWFTSMARHDRDLVEANSGVTTPPTAATIATYNVEAIGVIDQMLVDCVRPKDTNFRTSGLQIFQLRLSFGNAADLFTGGVVAAFVNMFVEIWTSELVEIPDAQNNVTTPIALRKVSYQEIALASSNVNQEIRIPAGNLIKEVFFRTDGSATAGEPSTAVLNNIQLASGVDVRANMSAASLRRTNSADYGYMIPGYYNVDFAAQGRAPKNLTEMWDVSNQAEPKAILDVTGGATVKMQVVTTEIILAQNR